MAAIPTDRELELDGVGPQPEAGCRLAAAHVVPCTPTSEQRNTRNGLNGFRLVLTYEEANRG